MASSIAKSLKEKNDIDVFSLDLVACPIVSCITKPENCSKGKNQTCVKKIDVVYEHNSHKKLVVLILRYQLNGSSAEGFIKKDDLSLNILIKRGIINKATLVAV